MLERRPPKGLLGGMLGFPTTDWTASPVADPPAPGDWADSGLEARHTFSHFHLRLAIYTATLTASTVPTRGHFVDARSFSPTALPTAMRKVFDLAATLRHD